MWILMNLAMASPWKQPEPRPVPADVEVLNTWRDAPQAEIRVRDGGALQLGYGGLVAGGEVVAPLSGDGIPGALLPQADGTLLWLEHGRFRDPSGAIVRFDLDAKKQDVLAAGLDLPHGAHLHEGHLVWLDGHDGTVRLDGEEIGWAGAALSSLMGSGRRLAGDGSDVYWISVRDDGGAALVHFPLDTRWPRKVREVPGARDTLVVGPEAVWISTDDALLRVSRDDGELARIAAELPGAVVLHEGWTYFIEREHLFGYAIRRVPAGGGVAQLLYRSPRAGSGLHLDGDALIWLESGHLEGECREEYFGCGQGGFTEQVCSGPGARLLRMPLTR